jgi:hypothetical protein
VVSSEENMEMDKLRMGLAGFSKNLTYRVDSFSFFV